MHNLKLAPAKKARIIEPNRETWIASTRSHLRSVNFRTVGSDKLDRMFGLPSIPLLRTAMVEFIEQEDAPEECQLCGSKLEDEFVEAVVKGARTWAPMCRPCHRKEGIGLGEGRGQLYVRQDEGGFKRADA